MCLTPLFLFSNPSAEKPILVFFVSFFFLFVSDDNNQKKTKDSETDRQRVYAQEIIIAVVIIM